MKLLRQAAPILAIAGTVSAVMGFGIATGASFAMRSVLHDLSRGGSASAIEVHSTSGVGQEHWIGQR
jgi:hypothetical protein